MIALTFLRHGRSSGDDLGVHGGRFDSELTAVGRAQVARLITRWERERRRFGRIVSSPLARATWVTELSAGEESEGPAAGS